MTEITDEEAVKAITEVAKNGEHTLTRDSILQLARGYKPRVVKLDIPEWGGVVHVREMTGAQRDAWEISQLASRGTDQRANLANARAKLVAFTVVDADGKRLFNDNDATSLGKLGAKALTRIYQVASDLSGLTAADMEELTRALGEDQSVNSGSN